MHRFYNLTAMACLIFFVACDSDNEFPETEVSLFDKTWVSSTGVESQRYRLNSNGTFNGGTDNGFDNQGVWNWVDEDEEVMRISYDNTVLWYRFENLTSNSNVTFISQEQPYVWDSGTTYSLSN